MMLPSTELSFVKDVAARSPSLTPEEERSLVTSYRDSGNPRAAERLVRAHLGMVITLALKNRHYGIPVADLVSEGNCGLLAALSKFDPDRGVRFATYAHHWVLARIREHAMRAAHPVSEGTGHANRRLFFGLRRERARLHAVHGEGRQTDRLVAERLKVSVDRLHEFLAARHGDSELLEELVAPDNPEELYFEDQRRAVIASAVEAALHTLSDRERFIVERHLMAAPPEQLSLTNIGKQLGVSRERVRQLKEVAKRKLSSCPALRKNPRLLEWRAA